MRFTIAILPILILFICCKESNESIKEFEFRDINQKEEIYSLVNGFILDSLFKNAVISIEAMGFCNAIMDESPPMPPGFYYWYDSVLFDTLMNSYDLRYKNIVLNKKFLTIKIITVKVREIEIRLTFQ